MIKVELLGGQRYIKYQGMYYDTHIHYAERGYENTDRINEAIDTCLNLYLKPDPHYQAGWLPTLACHMSFWNNEVDEAHKLMLQPKCHLMIYDSTWNPEQRSWLKAHVFGEVTIISVPKPNVDPDEWEAYVNVLDLNGLAYNFEGIPAVVAEAAIAKINNPEPAPTPTPTPTPTPVPDNEGHDIEEDAYLRLSCLQLAFEFCKVHNLTEGEMLRMAGVFYDFVMGIKK